MPSSYANSRESSARTGLCAQTATGCARRAIIGAQRRGRGSGRRVSDTIPYDRLSPRDFYRQLDVIRGLWDSATEPEMTRELQRFEALIDQLPGRYYELAKPLAAALGYCRLQRNSPYQARLVDLCDVVKEWDRERGRARRLA